MNARTLPVSALSLAVLLSACAPASTPGAAGSGGRAASTGGSVGTGSVGAVSTGGSSASDSGGSVGTGTGGSAIGSGGSDTSTGGGTSASGGAVGSGGTASGSGGSGGPVGGATVIAGGFSRPKGKIPSQAYPATMVNPPRTDWAKGLLSPTMNDHHHMNASEVVNGYLRLNGCEDTWAYDISDPAHPKQLSYIVSPHRDPKGGPKKEGEAESQQITYGKYGDNFYYASTAGKGVDIWNITDATKPVFLKTVELPGVAYGDFTEAVWGLSWQGNYIYIGATNTGLDILDATDPNNVTLAKRIPNSTFGGINAGPLWAVGNILVITTPKENGGIATLDISDPLNPVTLSTLTTVKSYIGGFYRHYAFLQSPLTAWDVLTDPKNIGTANSPFSTMNTPSSEYVAFSDDNLFLGHLRPNPGASKIDISDMKKMSITSRIWGRLDRGGINDDQFPAPIGNLLVLGDDQAPYYGAVLAVHAAEPDKKPPVVDSVIPKDKSTGADVKSRIGLSFTDHIELATLNQASLIVRPMGGGPQVTGKWGLTYTVINFSPDAPLQPKTTYEVILPAGGITDVVGNPIAQEFRSTFTTQ
ncbi:MAG: Ig-like domain-containing protein [Myxococcales bacterium]